MIISGFLYGQNAERFTIKKLFLCAKKILIDYFIFCFIALILNLIFNFENLTIENTLSFIFFAKFLPGIDHLWYVPLILFCYGITPILAHLKTSTANMRPISQYLLKFLSLGVLALTTESFFYHFNFAWIITYSAAFLFAEEIKNIPKTFKYILLPLIATVSILHYVMFCHFGSTMPVSIDRSITAFAIFFILYYLLSFIPHKNKNILLDFSDKYSYNLYLCHQIFILGPLSLLGATQHLILNVIITITAILLLTAFEIIVRKLLTLICNKIKSASSKEKTAL